MKNRLNFWRGSLSWLITLSLLASTMGSSPSRAAGKVADCPSYSNNGYLIRRFTNYAPGSRPGSMNGYCGRSAPDPGEREMGRDACRYYLEDHLAGRTRAVMAAVAQRGGTSRLLGGKYRAGPLERALGKSPVIVYAGDKYASKSNYQCKMDIVTKNVSSRQISAVLRSSGYLTPIGRMENLPQPVRQIQRNPDAQQPVAKTKRCRTVKLCKPRNSGVRKGRACNGVGPRWICFEKEQRCKTTAGSCTDLVH